MNFYSVFWGISLITAFCGLWDHFQNPIFLDAWIDFSPWSGLHMVRYKDLDNVTTLLMSNQMPCHAISVWQGEVQGKIGVFPSLVVEPVIDTFTRQVTITGSPFKSSPEKLEIVEFDSGNTDMGLSKVCQE